MQNRMENRVFVVKELFPRRASIKDIDYKVEGMGEDSEIDGKSRSLPRDLVGNESNSESEDNGTDSDDFVPGKEGSSNTDESPKTGILALHDEENVYDRDDQSDTSSQSSSHSAQGSLCGGRTQDNDSQDGVGALKISRHRSTTAVPDKHEDSVHMAVSGDNTGFELIAAFYDPSTPRERPQQGQATPLHFVLPGPSTKPDLGSGANLSTSVPAVPQGSNGHHINSSYNSGGVAAPPPGAVRDFGGPDAARHGGLTPLQDYQLQLYLLEQQNKKRFMMARQEQDNQSTTLAQDADSEPDQPPNDTSGDLGSESRKKHPHRAKL